MPYTPECQTHNYSNSLCGCCSDCSICWHVICCHSCARASAWAEVRGEQTMCCHTFIHGCFIRATIRKIRVIPDAYCSDCCVYTCCPYCALCQDLREIKEIKCTVNGNFGNLRRQDHSGSSINIELLSQNQMPFPNNPPANLNWQPYGPNQFQGKQI